MKLKYYILLLLLISTGTWAQNYVPDVGNEIPQFDNELFNKLMLKYSKEIESGDPFKEDPFNKDPYENLNNINEFNINNGKNIEDNLDFQIDQEINDELEQFNNEINENNVNLNPSLDNEINDNNNNENNDNNNEIISQADNIEDNEVIEQEMEPKYLEEEIQNEPELNDDSNANDEPELNDDDDEDVPGIDESANTRYTDFFNDSTVGQYFKEIYDKKNGKQNDDETKPTTNPEDINAIEPDIDYQLPKYFHFPIDY
jgi:hypothetical protein